MLNVLKLVLIFIVFFAEALTEPSDKANHGLLNDSPNQPEHVFFPTFFSNSFSKTLEGLIPVNLKPYTKFLLQSVNLKTILKSVAGMVVPTASYNPQISQQCREDSWLYAESLTNFTDWALKMLDASGKIPSGILSKNTRFMGHFHQCLKVRYSQAHDSKPKFTGKYCTVYLFPKPSEVPLKSQSGEQRSGAASNSTSSTIHVNKLHPQYLKDFISRLAEFPSVDLCLPSSCLASDVEIGVSDLFSNIGHLGIEGAELAPTTTEDFCTAADTKRNFDVVTVFAILVFTFLAFLLVLGTVHDAFLRLKAEHLKAELHTSQRILLSFSILTNGVQVLDTRNSGQGQIACINGIRFFSITWVVMNHTWKNFVKDPNANIPLATEDFRYWAFQPFVNGTVSVETSFFLTGLLVTCVTLRTLDRQGGRLNVPLMYLHRYLRLTPVYAFILLFNATLSVHMGSGPFWSKTVLMSKSCRASWWHHLLYFNNFIVSDANLRLCMPHTWYLAVDMQMFLVAPLLIYALWRWPKAGVALVAASIIVFTITTMTIVGTKNIPPTSIPLVISHPAYFSDYFLVPWCHLSPYLVGIFMGYVLHNLRNRTIAIKACTVVIGWLTSSCIALAVVYGLNGYYAGTHAPVFPKTVSILYASLNRTAWAVALSWLVFACVNGYGGFVNKMLSSSIFLPLSRLMYCTYLIQSDFQKFLFANLHTVPYYTRYDTLLQFLVNLIVSIGLAFVATVCVEIPFFQLEKLLFNSRNRAKKKHSEMQQVVIKMT